MDTISRFETGKTIVSRQFWQGKLWQARPEIIVRDSDDIIASFLSGAGTVIKSAHAPDGSPAGLNQLLDLNWNIRDETWFGLDKLRLSIPGEPYSVILFLETETKVFSAWYVNLEDPLVRTKQGFDYTDLILDIVAFPDLSHWRWKDERDLSIVLEYGGISAEKVKSLYEKGEEVITWMQSGSSPFSEWIDWNPDPSWAIPVLPETWDEL